MTYNEAFATCREQVSCEAVCDRYQQQRTRGNFIHCPLHPDKTASLKIYDDPHRGWYCYSCHKGGSSVDLVMAILGLTEPLEAVKQMDIDFGLQLELDRPQTRAERERAQRAQQERQQRNTVIERLEAWRWQTANMLADLLREADALDHEPTTKHEVLLVRYESELEYWFETLRCGDGEAVIELFMERKAVNKRCQMICEA